MRRINRAGELSGCRGIIAWMSLVGMVWLGLWRPCVSVADTEVNRVDRVKAAFVLNIARFVTWPAETFATPSAPLLLCLYRGNSLGQAMLNLEGQTVIDHRVSVQTVNSLADSQVCQILLIDNTEFGQYQAEARGETSGPLLTILDQTEADGVNTSRANVLITLVRKAARMGFEINLDRVRQAGLRMSSELLKLATIVDSGG